MNLLLLAILLAVTFDAYRRIRAHFTAANQAGRERGDWL